MMSTEDYLWRRSPIYYRNVSPERLRKDAAALNQLNQAYRDPSSRTRGNSLASVMTLDDNASIGGVQGWRIKEDAIISQAQQAAAAKARQEEAFAQQMKRTQLEKARMDLESMKEEMEERRRSRRGGGGFSMSYGE